MTDASFDARIGASFATSLNIADRLSGVMNIPEMVMAIQLERGRILDSQVIGQMTDMQDRNVWLREAGAALAAIRSACPNTKEGTADIRKVTFINSDGKAVNAFEWAKTNGIIDVFADLDSAGIKEANAAKEALAPAIAKASDDKTTNYPDFTDRDGKTINLDDWGVKKGYEAWDAKSSDNRGFKHEMEALNDRIDTNITAMNSISRTKFDNAIESMKSAIDTANTNSQLDQVRLQGLMDKRDNGFTMMTNTLARTNKNLDSILGNMR